MTTLVCTGFSPAGYFEYGRRFLETFWQYWPERVGLAVYTEEAVLVPRGECRSLWDCDGARAFYERHKDNPERCGRAPIPGWRPKDRGVGYAWRYDAVKFFRQCLIPEQAAAGLADGDCLAWLDGDVVTFATVPETLVEDMLGPSDKGADLVYLGRGAYHSEIGFWALRLNGRTRRFLAQLGELWRSDKLFALGEHHSAFAFDYCRKAAQRRGLIARNLTPSAAAAGHVWFQTELGRYTDHLKGAKRKQLGYSPEHPLKWWAWPEHTPGRLIEAAE
jgi:hypothetical protein